MERLQVTAFRRAKEFVFCHPTRGSKIDDEWYADEFRKALAGAGITDYVRPFHDARHASLTNGAAAGEAPIKLMARAGHRNISTTNQYLHLAGVVFREKAQALEDRMLGGGRKFYPTEPISPASRHRRRPRKRERETSDVALAKGLFWRKKL
jgi:hypothetical protein